MYITVSLYHRYLYAFYTTFGSIKSCIFIFLLQSDQQTKVLLIHTATTRIWGAKSRKISSSVEKDVQPCSKTESLFGDLRLNLKVAASALNAV